MNINPLLLTDFYKVVHHKCYVPNMTRMYSYWTPRMSRVDEVNEVVMFGLQGVIQELLIEGFNENFFNRPKNDVIEEYKRIITYIESEKSADTKHIEALHDLGYLPIRIKAIKEGTLVPIKVPMFEISNTHDDFGWLPNSLETLISHNVWLPITSATTGHNYRNIVNYYYDKTVCDGSKNKACGDFSMRGMSSTDSAMKSGASHLLSFTSSATIPSALYLEKYYDADLKKDVILKGTPSTEHSVMSSYGRENELEAYRKLITEIFPTGLISIVSDTYDFWDLVSNQLPKLKENIINRDGKVIIRPDSGDPVDIICGGAQIEDFDKCQWVKTFQDCKDCMNDILEEYVREDTPHGECGADEEVGIFKFEGKYYKMSISIDWNRYDKQYYFIESSYINSCEEIELSVQQKGLIEVLWDNFGGTINSKGYKVLDSHIGAIYGDSITVERAKAIYNKLEAKGFACSNIILGVGSYSYNFVTRDSYGQALKATHAIVNGKERFIFKAPKTDTDNFKKSQKGRCVVFKNNEGLITYKDELYNQEAEDFKNNLLETVFINGKFTARQNLKEIRNILNGGKF